MTIRCKFKVDAITRRQQSVQKLGEDGLPVKDERGHHVYVPGEVWDVEMSPVYANGDPSHENSKFWAASPGGNFKVTTVNASAVASLKLGGEYYIDITPAG